MTSASASGPPTVEEVAERLAAVRARIVAAGADAEADVSVLAVTKGFGPELIDVAVAAGCTGLGENYVQELVAKRDAIEACTPRPEVHMIGQLQSNKVRAIARLDGLVSLVETVDRASLVDELARRCPGQRILVQVAAVDEPGKGGATPDEVPRLVEHAIGSGLRVDGLMTVGPTSGETAATRTAFRAVRALVDRLGLTICSMGMSADLEIAVAEGSTQVRVGSALFGPRPPRRP